jgi:adenosylcobinamide-GDP ribazoletransferase
MKDPNVGAIAVVTLVIVLLLKWSCLQSVLLNKEGLVLLITPMLGRCAILVLMLTTPYISPQGLGGGLTQNLPRPLTRMVVFSCISIGIYALGFAPLLVASLLLIWLHYLSMQRLAGVTGDVYGASVELVETAVLMGCIALI